MQVPHTVWQRLLTKTTGPKEGQVDLFDLLKAALRSRPDYIIPGEVRGAEGNIVFQAMQTGHPCMTTFHAGSITQVIQRFTETPISVTQLIKWGTINSSIAAYLWLCLQYGRSFFLCGGTACGKTTTMNSIIPFIPPEK